MPLYGSVSSLNPVEELHVIDALMKDISDVTDPNELVEMYSNGMDRIFPVDHWVSLSRRGVDESKGEYLITRSHKLPAGLNPWRDRAKLPLLRGGILGEVVYAEKPTIITDLSKRLRPDDPAYEHLEGLEVLVSLPNYEKKRSINVGCFLFPKGVQFDVSRVPVLLWQANLFGRYTHNLVLRQELQTAYNTLDRELQVVGQIQRDLLPQELPVIPGYSLATSYETSARAGGDYYDFFPLGNGAYAIVIADVSGHGTPAAVVMAVTHAIAHTRPGLPSPPSEVLAHLNHHLANSYTTNGTFVTAFFGVLDPTTNTLSYACAGHNPPRLVRRAEAGGLSILSLDGQHSLPLGIDGAETFRNHTLRLQRGDQIVLYTDGITEAMPLPEPASETAEGEATLSRLLFGTERLDALLTQEPRSPRQQIDAIRSALSTFTRNAPPTDDRTLVIIHAEG
jgi:sigma-B regulation protein RsbU (phosphoserine phosphatase)